MADRFTQVADSPAGQRRRMMLFLTAILLLVSLSSTLASALHYRPHLIEGVWRRDLLLALGETLVLVIAGSTLLIRVCNPFIRQLEESDARMRAIVCTAGDGIITVDSRGTINSFNQAAERMFGRSEAEVLGTPIERLLLLSSGRGFEHELIDCPAAPQRRESQKALGRSRGGEFPVELSLARVCAGERAVYTLIARDVTERESAQQVLRLQMLKLEEVKNHLEIKAEELAKTNRELDDLSYIASHDLKEPLRGISSYCQILLEDYGDRLDADGERRLQALVKLCQRLSRLIDDVLAYSQLGRKQPEAAADADLHEIACDVLETLGPAIDQRGASVCLTGQLPSLPVDRVWVGEVFRNLIGNALKFNDCDQARVEIGSLDDGTIFVRDNGIGIPACHHEAIFAMFRRLYPRSQYEGTGAGLSFVRKIVEAHGGRVWVESEPGQGATFYFTLSPEAGTKRDEHAGCVAG